MYVVYYGANNSIVVSMAAAMHLANFSLDIPQNEHSKYLQEFYDKKQQALGRLLYIGNDDVDNQVFILNVANSETILLPALQSVFTVLEISHEQLYLADTTTIDNLYISLGMFLYKHQLFPTTATQLLFTGIKKEEDKVNKIISKAKIFSKKN